MGRGFAAALGLALALPFALSGTTFLVVPTAEGSWRGIVDPPGAGHLLAALLLGAAAAVATARARPEARRVLAPFLVGLLAAAPIVPVLTGHGLLLLAFAWPLVRILLFAAAGMAVARLAALEPMRVVPVARHETFGVLLLVVFYSVVWRGWPGPAGPQGDEPHYLTMAESLRSDGDLDLRDDMAERAYAPFYSGTLAPHVSPASPPGREYSIHTPGLPALLLPAYAAGGYAGARLLMSLLAAATAWVVFRLVRDVTGSAALAAAGTAALALTPPFAFYAVSMYPEMPVALAAALLLTAARGASPAWTAAALLAAAAVPWLHPKYLPLAAVGVLLTCRRRAPAWSAAAILGLTASVAAFLWFMHAHYGRASLSAAYGPGFSGDVSLARAPWGSAALLFDRQFGLFAVAPIWWLALPGAALLARRSKADAGRALLLAGAAFGVNASFSMWWGGTCPPARFLVPCLPAAALFVAMAAAKRPGLAGALAGAGLGVLALAEEAPRALHNRADGESALLRVLSRGLDLDPLFPSYVAADPAVWMLSASLVAVFALAWVGGGRGLAVGAAGYALVIAGVRSGPPGLDTHGATLALLDGYDDRALVAVTGAVRPETLRLPLRLPEAPWTFTENVRRRSRPIDLAPGRYRIAVDGAIVEALPTAHVVRLDLLSDDERLGRTYLEDGAPAPSFELDLPRGARRLLLEATGIQGTGRIEAVTVLPREILPRRARAREAAPEGLSRRGVRAEP